MCQDTDRNYMYLWFRLYVVCFYWFCHNASFIMLLWI